jgi:hypothetical protein
MNQTNHDYEEGWGEATNYSQNAERILRICEEKKDEPSPYSEDYIAGLKDGLKSKIDKSPEYQEMIDPE